MSNVNKSLEIEDVRTHEAYLRTRECLIQAVRDVHPEHNETNEHLPHAYNFLEQFDTAIPLNYDLIVYWTMTYGLDIQDRHKFKDCFLSEGISAEDWQWLRSPYDERPGTLVFYPHGSLVLYQNRIEQERKICIRSSGLLASILERWQSEDVVPSFVSKGTHEQKVNSTQNSTYLSIVYREIPTERCESLVIFGWGMDEHDVHLLKRMARTGIRRVVVSVFRGNLAYCTRVNRLIRDNLGQDICIESFGSEGPGCWNEPQESQ